MPTYKPKVTIVFGRMGAGKSEIGEILASKINSEFYEGDNDVPKSMKDKVAKFDLPSLQEIDVLVDNLIAGIKKKLSQNISVVVAQALYLNSHRLKLLETFKDYDIQFVYVATPMEKQHRQLKSRKDGDKWVEYAKVNDPYFQEPDAKLNAHVVRNDSLIKFLIAELQALPLVPKQSVITNSFFPHVTASAEIINPTQDRKCYVFNC